MKTSEGNSSNLEKVTKQFEKKVETLEKSEQAKITEILSLKDIIDRVRAENEKQRKQTLLLEDKLDQKEQQIIQFKHDAEETQRRLKML